MAGQFEKQRRATAAVLASGAVTLSLLPAATTAAAADGLVSAWGKDTHSRYRP
ncbi:hypothetical protein [Streptomyces sp. NPDC005244]|uniref:hypothetical protein n=1 Tax=Streptomyces sp. NPDC005244 TaxID=3364708 RepID=UPI003684D73A